MRALGKANCSNLAPGAVGYLASTRRRLLGFISGLNEKVSGWADPGLGLIAGLVLRDARCAETGLDLAPWAPLPFPTSSQDTRECAPP